jgi:BirA family transcriptional regulator, biotin operon repressor / biotin---[acetyl-CoA-carboxylase] ligase
MRPFHAEELLHYLGGLHLGHPIYLFHTIGSTNDEAKRLADSGAPEGLLVIAEEQTAGRGRTGRTWITPLGQAIAISLILRPANLPADQATQLMMLAGLAVCQAVEQVTALQPELKWPNDVLLSGKKVAGLLLETALRGDQLDYAVLGLGLNVNFAPPPEEVDFPATSLQAEARTKLDRQPLLRAILEQLEALYPLVGAPNQALYRAWSARLALIGEPIVVRTTEGDQTGLMEGVTPDGALLLKQPNGQMLKLLAGDVRLRPAR